jgi:ubiquitin-conjugating enzyme E2 R
VFELRKLKDEPLEGFRIIKVDETDLYEWIVAVYGPPGTVYEGGYFKAVLRFPGDYPFSPPTFRFLTRLWHAVDFSSAFSKKNLLFFEVF